jgi:hypothetical protein
MSVRAYRCLLWVVEIEVGFEVELKLPGFMPLSQLELQFELELRFESASA